MRPKSYAPKDDSFPPWAHTSVSHVSLGASLGIIISQQPALGFLEWSWVLECTTIIKM